MKKVVILVLSFCVLFGYGKLNISKVDNALIESYIKDCEENSISDKCLFVGLYSLYPEIIKNTYNDIEFSSDIDIKKEDGLKYLKKACIYDKDKKILAIKTKTKPELINSDPIACYSLFVMYENFSDSSNYHKNYIKAMRPYVLGYDSVDIFELIKADKTYKKDLKQALNFYKHMCYEADLQMQCAKYQGFKTKLINLCKKGFKYACE